jgi:hypothetical protein
VIECDGLYWHSDAVIAEKDYHKQRRQYYIDNGYQPLFFREDEINMKPKIVESIILNKLNKSQKIWARKCNIVEIDKNCAREFFNNNHLMGYGSGQSIGLLYQDKLVAAMQFFKRNDITEISRFCTIIQHSVVGGFSKLLCVLSKPLSTFIDLRYGSGNYLDNLGFKRISDYTSFKWTYGGKTHHRMQFLGNSGYKHGMYKIWDCGQSKYLLP